MVQEDVIPYIAELSKSVDFNKAAKQEAKNQLEHTMTLLNKAYPNGLWKLRKNIIKS